MSTVPKSLQQSNTLKFAAPSTPQTPSQQDDIPSNAIPSHPVPPPPIILSASQKQTLIRISSEVAEFLEFMSTSALPEISQHPWMRDIQNAKAATETLLQHTDIPIDTVERTIAMIQEMPWMEMCASIETSLEKGIKPSKSDEDLLVRAKEEEEAKKGSGKKVFGKKEGKVVVKREEDDMVEKFEDIVEVDQSWSARVRADPGRGQRLYAVLRDFARQLGGVRKAGEKGMERSRGIVGMEGGRKEVGEPDYRTQLR